MIHGPLPRPTPSIELLRSLHQASTTLALSTIIPTFPLPCSLRLNPDYPVSRRVSTVAIHLIDRSFRQRRLQRLKVLKCDPRSLPTTARGILRLSKPEHRCRHRINLSMSSLLLLYLSPLLSVLPRISGKWSLHLQTTERKRRLKSLAATKVGHQR